MRHQVKNDQEIVDNAAATRGVPTQFPADHVSLRGRSSSYGYALLALCLSYRMADSRLSQVDGDNA